MERFDTMISERFQVMYQQGNERICVCPWHHDTGKPNLSVNAVSGLYHCWVCGASGSLVKKGQILPPVTDKHLRRQLARGSRRRRTGEEVVLAESTLAVFKFPHDFWTKERGFRQGVIDQFQLGYDFMTGRVTIPLRDFHGRLLGVTFRHLDDTRPKYVDPTGYKKGRHLFGAWLPSPDPLVLTEGPLDAVAMRDAGFSAVAMMGARLTPDQLRVILRLRSKHVIICTDADPAGRRAALDIGTTLKGTGLTVSVPTYPSGYKDPGEMPEHERKMLVCNTPQ